MIKTYQINLAIPAEASQIALLSREAIEQGLGWNWTPQRVRRSMRDRASNTIVARNAEGMLGFAIMKYADDEAHLLLLAVESAMRRQGVGSALLAWLELTVRTAGIRSVRLETRAQSAEARAFYRTKGYQQLRVLSGYYQGLEDAVLLEKKFGS